MSELLTLSRLVFSQKAKLIEMTNEYRVRDENGREVGVVREEGQSKAKKVLRLVSSLDQFMTHTLVLYDASGARVLELVRPRKVLKSTVEVRSASGDVLGRIRQENVIGKIRFALEDASGASLGALRAENWRAWDFQLTDGSGAEVARITKKWAGLGKELFTTADNYVVEIAPTVADPLRSLCLAAGAGVDTALKQDSR